VALIAQDGVDLTPTESTELSHRAFAPRGNRADAKRALAIMLLAAGESYTDIQKAIGCSSQFVARWKARFLAERLAGLDPVEPEGRRSKRKQPGVTPQQASRVLAKSRETPPKDAGPWTPESLGRTLRLDAKRVAEIWQAAGIDPKRVECFRDATDPSFEDKTADLIGLYVQGPQRVAVFALGARETRPPAAKAPARNGNGHANGNGHSANGNGHAAGDISSSGSLSLYAMLNGPRGLMRKPSPAAPSPRETTMTNGAKGDKHPNAAGFIDEMLKKGSTKRAMHVFVEGLDDKRAADLRAAYRRRSGVQLHFAESYPTWLNQVDIWLAKIDRDFVAGKVLTRHAELRHKVMQSLRANEKRAQSLRWSVGEP
jgi:transposase